MQELSGYGIGTGVVVAPILRMPEPLPEPSDSPLQTPPGPEKERAAEAIQQVVMQLEGKATQHDGQAAEILQTTAAIAADPALATEVKSRIDSGSTAERAVFGALREYAEMLKAVGGYMAERAVDLADVSQRILAALAGVPAPEVPESELPFILVAKDLSPADTATLDYNKVKGLVTEEGGPTGHTAILARSKGIPTLIGVKRASELIDHTVAVLDAPAGKLLVDPEPEVVNDARIRQQTKIELPPVAGEATFADGSKVSVFANIGSIEDARYAASQGVDGVGLFRTEFVFLSEGSAPSLETQTEIYKEVFDCFPGKKVTVRTLDAGADKPLPFLPATPEPNPALGVRGYRITRANEAVGKTQLEAIAKAAAASSAEVWTMAPMVADAPEAKAFTQEAHDAGLQQVGVMAEVPSIALVADQVFEVCDFVSIGTNDLTQYAMAADRLLTDVAEYQDPWHPAVLRLIKTLGEAASAAGRPLGVCGEAASDPTLAPVLIGLGATSLSMTVAAIPEVKASLMSTTRADAEAAAEAACAAWTASEAKEAARQLLR